MTRLLSAAMAVALSVVSLQPAFAAPKKISTTPNPIHGQAKAKNVTFHVRNDSAQALTVRDGDAELTMAPGQTAELTLPNGSPIIAVSGNALMQPGTLITAVTPALQGNTLAIR